MTLGGCIGLDPGNRVRSGSRLRDLRRDYRSGGGTGGQIGACRLNVLPCTSAIRGGEQSVTHPRYGMVASRNSRLCSARQGRVIFQEGSNLGIGPGRTLTCL